MRVSFCTPRLVDSLVALQCQSHGRSSQVPANCIAVSTRSSDRPSPFVKNAKVTSRGCRQRERAKFRREIGTIDVLNARPATRENIELQLEGGGPCLDFRYRFARGGRVKYFVRVATFQGFGTFSGRDP